MCLCVCMDTHTCMHVSTLCHVFCFQLKRICVSSDCTGDRAGAPKVLGLLTGPQWQAPLDDWTVRCPASVSPKCNSEGSQEVKANPHTPGGAEAARVVCMQLCELQKRAQQVVSFLQTGILPLFMFIYTKWVWWIFYIPHRFVPSALVGVSCGAAHFSRQLQKWAAGRVLSSTSGLMAASEANRLHSYSYYHILVSAVRDY